MAMRHSHGRSVSQFLIHEGPVRMTVVGAHTLFFFRTVGGPSLAYKLSQATSRNAQDRVRDELGSSRFLKSNGCSQAACVPCGVRAVRAPYDLYNIQAAPAPPLLVANCAGIFGRAPCRVSRVPRAACPIGAPGRRTVSRQCPCQCPSAVPSVVPFTASRLAVPHVCAPLAVSRAACPYRALESRRRGHAKEEGPPVREGPLCGTDWPAVYRASARTVSSALRRAPSPARVRMPSTSLRARAFRASRILSKCVASRVPAARATH